ncbi:class A beta-lactamase, subclass A2 [Sphingobacterium griseoflavum]|uniref:beta-lactamase n=1 Tax=Sphingobacterium griseoflavum TaxID=1474952 RepID=A0ABQ3HZH5_9SPHI|nr:class A beta-lactamase, subclass A2 [Sphingobacterium griseoflavum]GHE42707.1 CepA family class A extended-spectrum beta-lactamase [Sphingobacterium griseoflavum]
MIKKFLSLSIAVLLYTVPTFGQISQLRAQIEACTQDKDAIVAVAIQGVDKDDQVYVRATERLPMQSVFKFHIAVAMLTAIDKGKFKLEQAIAIKKRDLTPEIWSPLREKYPHGATLPISEILTFMLAQSDNVACDVLLKLLGGPAKVDRFYKDRGIRDLAIAINEKTMQSNWDMQFLNWTTAAACADLMQTYFYNRHQELSATSHAFLWRVMSESQTGLKRLKGKLPADVTVAHKTGFSGTKDGTTAAVHDAGVIFLPNGEPLFITVFVSDSKEDLQTNEAVIAEVARMGYDYFVKQSEK